MVVIYGWTYAVFSTGLTWHNATEANYVLWENVWSRKVDAYIYTDSGTSPRLTDANEKLDVGDIVNEMMVQMSIYLKAENTESPLETGLYDAIGFPSFKGSPKGLGTGHYLVLNKLRRKYSETEVRVDSIRHGLRPDANPFPSGMRFY